MTTNRTDTDDLALLARTLDAFGSDDSRWPADRRQRCRAAARTASGAQLLREARAFDQAISGLETKSAGPPSSLKPLADRIMAEIGPQAAAPPRRAVIAMPIPIERAQRTSRTITQSRWLPGAAIAASLLVGVLVGAGTSVGGAVGDLAEALGFGGDFGSITLAYRDDVSGFDEEAL